MRRKERTLSRRSFDAYFSGRHSSSATRLSELVSLVPEFFWIAALAVFIGYIVFGLIGSGAAYIVVPVISHVWAPTFLLPVASALDLTAALAISRANTKNVALTELYRMIPMAFIGAVAGVTLLVSLPRSAVFAVLGSAAIFFGMMTLAFASMALIYLFPEEMRGGALLGLTGFYALAVVSIILGFRRYLARQPKPFSGTISELKEDVRVSSGGTD